jgi:hypothetical protein
MVRRVLNFLYKFFLGFDAGYVEGYETGYQDAQDTISEWNRREERD